MKTTLCFLALFGLAFGLPSSFPEYNFSDLTPNNIYVEPIEGAPEYPKARVIGGTEVTRNSIPFQAAVIINGASFCGGSLISTTAVLTAAHCTVGASYVQVRLAAHNVQQTETGVVTVTSTSFRNHASYNTPTQFANDIAVIILPSAVSLSSTVQTVSLAPASAGTYAGNTGTLTGWGRTSDASNAISPVLRRVDLNIITNAVCQSSFGSVVTTSNICTSGAGGVGGCNGDSGGPVVVNGVQVGVVSFGSTSCQAGHPTVFARVSSFRPWITTNAGV